MTSHERRLSRLKDLVPDVIGFPAEPWKLVGVRRVVWFHNLEAAAFTNHLLLAHVLNLAADKDDLPVAMDYPTGPRQPLVLRRTPGRGNVLKNQTWLSFIAWHSAVTQAPGLIEEERRRAELRQMMAGKQMRPVALRPLPYGHDLGPTGTAPKTFGHAGGGNRNNVLSTNVNKSRKEAFRKLGAMFESNSVVTDVGDGNFVRKWDARLGFSLVGHRPLYPYPDVTEQNRRDDASRKQHSRIKANGGKRKPIGRPRTISTDKEQRALELLAAGWGIKRIAKEIGTGVSFVQRVGGTANRPG